MPLAYRVIFIQLVAFGWNIYLSLQANKQTWLPFFYLAIGANLPDAELPVLYECKVYIFRMLRAYQKSIERRPLLTNMITAGSLGLAGDLIAQKRVESRESVDWVEGYTCVFFCT